MRKLFIIAGLAVGFYVTPASATTLSANTITTAGTVTSTPIQTKDWAPENVSIQCNFTYGSGGKSADAYVQTSVDGGTTWIDLAECSFATTTARKGYNLSTTSGGTARFHSLTVR